MIANLTCGTFRARQSSRITWNANIYRRLRELQNKFSARPRLCEIPTQLFLPLRHTDTKVVYSPTSSLTGTVSDTDACKRRFDQKTPKTLKKEANPKSKDLPQGVLTHCPEQDFLTKHLEVTDIPTLPVCLPHRLVSGHSKGYPRQFGSFCRNHVI